MTDILIPTPVIRPPRRGWWTRPRISMAWFIVFVVAHMISAFAVRALVDDGKVDISACDELVVKVDGRWHCAEFGENVHVVQPEEGP